MNPAQIHFPFCPDGKGAERQGQRERVMSPEAVPLAAGFGDGGGVPKATSVNRLWTFRRLFGFR